MKKRFAILLISSLLALSCSGSPRFTSDDDNTEKSRYPKTTKKDEETRVPVESTKPSNINKSMESVSGVASFYSEKFHGRKTANGETYDMHALTAAHENYPFNTIVRVRNLKNNRTVTLRINDRKPDFNGRIIDVSLKAAQELDMVISGIAHVQVEVLEWGK